MSADDVGSRSLKRGQLSKEDSDLDATVPYTFQRHPDFWFDDGSIILVAQQTGFRVYRGLLASQSTIFSDMLSASSSSFDESLDGCPVVQLTDSSQDLAYLFGVLIPRSPIQYMSNADQPRSFDEVSAVIRLADKYHIESLQDHALRSLQRYHFTSDFAAFSGPPDTKIAIEPINAVGAVNLAQLTETPRMLPLALYRCCCLPNDVLRMGWTRADGTVEHLSPADFQRCTNARARLLALHSSFYESGLLNDLTRAPPCAQSYSCAWVTSLMREHLREALAAQLQMDEVDVFHGWARQLEALVRASELCENCLEVVMREHREVSRRVWDALPGLFGIKVDGWGSPGAK